MAYAATSDLLLGNLPLGNAVDPERYVNDAAEEIDTKIGFKYITPVDLNTLSQPEQRPTLLLLKRLNVYIATGRILITITQPTENNQLNALGQSYLMQAYEVLDAIAAGEYPLIGVPPLGGDTGNLESHIGVTNGDTGSFVDSFYTQLQPQYPAGWVAREGRFYPWSE